MKNSDCLHETWDRAREELDEKHFHGFLCRVYGTFEALSDHLEPWLQDIIRSCFNDELSLQKRG